VLNYAAVIEEGYGSRLGEDGVRMLGRVRTSAESAAALLDQLVQVGSAGHEREERVEIDMTALARGVRDELIAAGGDAADVRFDLRDLPPAWGSAALVRCVLRNLFSNSVKYTRGRDDRRILVTAVVGEAENAYTVIDNGIGFDPSRRDSLFEPSPQPRGAHLSQGAGLGLAIAARIVRQHRGRIWAESDGTLGARISFTLPRAAATAASEPETAADRAQPAAVTS